MIDVLIGIAGTALLGVIGYAVSFINSITRRIEQLEKKEIEQDNSIKHCGQVSKNHINSCTNWEKRKEWID